MSYTPASAATNTASTSRTLLCRLCSKPIKFDARRVSNRTGKMIPLDVDTNEPHNCPIQPNPYQSQSQQSQQPQPQPEQIRYHQCNKGCGQEIYFDAKDKIVTGKWKPFDKQTRMPHECPQQLQPKPQP